MHKQIFTSSIWMFLGSALQQILQFVVFILLARLLTPDVFGQVALASVVIDIALALSIWGVNDLMIQRRHVTQRLISQVFNLSLTVAVIMSVLIAGGVGVYVWLNGFTIVTKLILMLIPIIIVQGFGVVPDIIIKRDLDFKWLAIRNNLAALIGGGVALVFAYMGFGIYALVIQKLVALVVLSSSVWMAVISKGKTFKLYRYSIRTMVLISRHSLQLLAGAMSGL